MRTSTASSIDSSGRRVADASSRATTTERAPSASDLGELLGLLQVDEALEHVLDEHGPRLDLDVPELLGPERLDGLHTAAKPSTVPAVPPTGHVESLGPDADGDDLPT